MNSYEWQILIQELKHSKDVNRAVRAGEKMAKLADESRVPDLYALLEEDSFFIREMVAEPLARLEGVKALPALFQALTRGFEDGHDNDGLQPIIAYLIEENPEESLPLLMEMLKSSDERERENAAWGLECLQE